MPPDEKGAPPAGNGGASQKSIAAGSNDGSDFNLEIPIHQLHSRPVHRHRGRRTAVYLLSAKSTPEGVHEQVVERLEKCLPAEPEYIRHVIQDAKFRDREAKNKKGKREARAARKAKS